MSHVAYARAQLDAACVEYQAANPGAVVEEVDIDLCEDAQTVMFTAHLSDGHGLCALVTLDAPIRPDKFDRKGWQTALEAVSSVLRH